MITVAFSVLLLASEAASATSGQPAAEVSQPAEAPKAEKKICKREIASESRLAAKRVCLTAAEWKARRSQFTNDLGDVSK